MGVAFGQQRGLLVYNIKDYGAVGDGVADDSAAIQAVVNLLPSNGGAIYTPPGTFLIGTPININAISGNLTLIGAGWSSVWKLKNGTNDFIVKHKSGSMQGARIAYMKFDCNGTNQTTASGGILAYKWRRTLIEHCWFHDPWQAAIFFNADSGDFGYQNRVVNNFIEGGSNITSGTNAYGEAIRLINTDENQIYGNHFENNGNFNDTTYGFHIYDQNGLTTYAMNSFVNGAGCIKLDGHQCRIIGNAFDGNGGNAIQINSAAAQTTVEGNTIINVGYRATGGSANAINAMRIDGTQCTVKNNYFESDASATPKTRAFANINSTATYLIFEDNEFNVKASSGTVAPITFVSTAPTPARIRKNVGPNVVSGSDAWITESAGTASITTGNTSMAVNHGLSVIPSLNQIQIAPQTSLGSATFWWISNPTSTQFTINLNVNPAATVTFGWRIESGYY